jgi:hypothetical protein
VLAVLATVTCPFNGQEMTMADCRAFSSSRAPTHHPLKLTHWRTCRKCKTAAKESDMQQTAAPQRPVPAFLPINALMLQAEKVEVVIQELGRRGFAVVGIDMSSLARPTVQIQTSARCAQLIDSGQAAYYGFGQARLAAIAKANSAWMAAVWFGPKTLTDE